MADSGNAGTTVEVQPKSVVQRSEMWLSLIAVIGAIASAMVKANPLGITIVTVAVIVLTVGVFALFKTDLPSAKPGVKTKAFWVGVATIVGSIALALSETPIPGLSESVSKYAGLIATLIAAAGYNVVRYKAKTAQTP